MIKLVIIAELYNSREIWNSFLNHLGYLNIVKVSLLSAWLSLWLLSIPLLAYASLRLDLCVWVQIPIAGTWPQVRKVGTLNCIF